MILTISGTAYYECFDPNASTMAAEIGLPEPRSQKVGRGERFNYCGISVAQAREVAEHMRDMGELWFQNADSYDRTAKLRYRRLAAEGERLLERLS